MKKVSWFVGSFAVAFGLLIFAAQVDSATGESAVPASSPLIFDWVSDEVEAELECDYFIQCIHLEIVDSAQCPASILIELGFFDSVGRPMSDEDVIMPSPKFTGGHIIEIGTNVRAEVGEFGVYDLTCSSSAPTVIAAS